MSKLDVGKAKHAPNMEKSSMKNNINTSISKTGGSDSKIWRINLFWHTYRHNNTWHNDTLVNRNI